MSSQIFSDSTPISSRSQLVEYLASGGKPSEKWVIGTEHEKLGWDLNRGHYPTYEGPHGIGWLLGALERENGWTATREGDSIVALAKAGATITLEPGGQLELSGAPLRRLSETEAEFDAHMAEIRALCAPHGVIWSGVGFAPVGAPADMPLMPKARYGIMRRYLPTRGRLALRMMFQTCTTQANYDFADEADAFRKLRASLLVQPLVLGAFAASPIVDGAVSPYRTYRGHIWEHTDDDRFIYPAHLLAEGATFEQYVDWVVDVPMFLIFRDGEYVDCAGLTFSAFMAKGFEGHHATMADFALHLSTIFPDARLKTHLEVRAGDMGDRAHVLALPALHTGLLYDAQALDALLDRLGGWSYETLWALRRQVPELGLTGSVGGESALSVWKDVLRIARDGLSRWEPGSERLLDVLDHEAASGEGPADRLRRLWTGDAGKYLEATRIC